MRFLLVRICVTQNKAKPLSTCSQHKFGAVFIVIYDLISLDYIVDSCRVNTNSTGYPLQLILNKNVIFRYRDCLVSTTKRTTRYDPELNWTTNKTVEFQQNHTVRIEILSVFVFQVIYIIEAVPLIGVQKLKMNFSVLFIVRSNTNSQIFYFNALGETDSIHI